MMTLRSRAVGVARPDFLRLSGALALQVTAAALLFSLHVVGARVLAVENYGALSFGLTLGGVLTLLCTLGYPNLLMRQVAGYATRGSFGLLKGLVLHAARRVGAVSLATAVMLAGLASYPDAFDTTQRSGFGIAALVVLFYPQGALRAKTVRGLGSVAGGIVPEDLVRPALFIALLVLAHAAAGSPGMPLVGALLATAMLASLALGLLWAWRLLPFAWGAVVPSQEASAWGRASRRMLAGGLLQELTYRTDIIALGFVASMAATAEYSAAAKLATICVFGLQVIDLYYAPRLAAAHAAGDTAMLRQLVWTTMRLSLLAAAPVLVVLFTIPGELLAIFGPDYVAAAPVLQILAAGYFVSAATGSVGHALLMTGRESAFARITAMTAVVTLVGHAAITPAFGTLGAASVTAAAVAFQNLAMLYAVYRQVLGDA